ncbi:ABC transporter substrate-binding protein [Pseudoalteromonas denitrificans]|uniref:ABC-type branched-chain amino acid transport system, substrate-binding protein n=1 Tax=Pseudoalteromonas denitrificans DSM 6059 TaxID=1123010 RepID=A0A1I1LT68_9GAMM|nr:ABC transporter substrate-binding protein [Pseudoalteromonas denitrificans]SFC72660.1 ABC-type branched-chain amino acid transport system, substrate-binding protein [Pseudoalteromonas denitrificans DSM 6059]
MNKLCKLKIYIMGVLFIVSCGGAHNDDANTPLVIDIVAQQFKQDAINIGSISPRLDRLNSCLLAAKQINEVGGVLGKELNIVGFIATSTEQSTEFVKKMLEVDIQAIELQFSSRALAAADFTVPAEKVLLASTAQSTSISNIADNDLVFRFQPRTDTISLALAKLAFEKGGRKAVVIHNSDDIFGVSLFQQFSEAFMSLGGEIVAEISFPIAKENGFDDELRMLEASGADVILNNMLMPSLAANFYNEALNVNFEQYVHLTGNFTESALFTDNLVDASKVDGLLGLQSPRGNQLDENVKFYQASFAEQFDVTQGSFSNNVYDACQVAALAIERAGRENNTDTPTGLMIRNSLRAVMNPPGEIAGAVDIGAAFEILRSGGEIDFNGTYTHEWDEKGDLIGDLTFDISSFDGINLNWIISEQFVIHVESNP